MVEKRGKEYAHEIIPDFPLGLCAKENMGVKRTGKKGFRAIPKTFHPLSLAHGDGQFQDVLTAFGGSVASIGEEFIAKGLQGVLYIRSSRMLVCSAAREWGILSAMRRKQPVRFMTNCGGSGRIAGRISSSWRRDFGRVRVRFGRQWRRSPPRFSMTNCLCSLWH